MPFEPVYMVWDYYDGVRSGIASYQGSSHYFDCVLDRENGEYADVFELWPIDEDLFSLAMEHWHIYRNWERQFHSGESKVETHPGHRGQNSRYDVLQERIDQGLEGLGVPVCRAKAKFQVCAGQPPLPSGCIRELEVEWMQMPSQETTAK